MDGPDSMMLSRKTKQSTAKESADAQEWVKWLMSLPDGQELRRKTWREQTTDCGNIQESTRLWKTSQDGRELTRTSKMYTHRDTALARMMMASRRCS